MKASDVFFWFIWIMSIIFILISIPNYEISILIPLMLLFLLTGMVMYSQVFYKRRFRRLGRMMKSIDFEPLERELTRMERMMEGWNLKVSNLEKGFDDLENYKREQEKKYRDLVRKVLEVDNKLNQKYKKLGESIIELSKKIEKS